MSPEKSIGLLLKASVLVHAQFPGVRFEVVGGGRALADMKRLAACVGARVAFRGPVYAELPEVGGVARALPHGCAPHTRPCGATGV